MTELIFNHFTELNINFNETVFKTSKVTSKNSSDILKNKISYYYKKNIYTRKPTGNDTY